MNDEEFRKLEKKYYDELTRRESITHLKNKINNVDNMLVTLTNDDPYTTIVEMAVCLTTLTTLDGNYGGDTTSTQVKLTKDLTIKVLTQVKEELQNELDDVVNRG